MSTIESLKASLKSLNLESAKIRELPPDQRAAFGREINAKKARLLSAIVAEEEALLNVSTTPIDLTAPTLPGAPIPDFPSAAHGSKHPLMTELDRVLEIYQLMGFDVVESYQLDDEFHMFDSLNFEKAHPARDGYDTFRTEEGFIPPAHTSTMQYRILKSGQARLRQNLPIATVVPGRVFRNEDVDATHEHTFYQCEGVYVSKDCSLAQMLGVLREFFERYYEQKLNIRTQPAYFPFTEPSLEFMIEKPTALGGKKGDFLEMLGCGMIHPNVLKTAGIDPTKYHGFAWGGGIDRLVMLRFGLTDVRYFESGNLTFLKEFR